VDRPTGDSSIIRECCGFRACGTCHCYVEETRLGELPFHRLACQIKATAALEGLVVVLSETQG
jgi:2Fe-2S ferredoxin